MHHLRRPRTDRVLIGKLAYHVNCWGVLCGDATGVTSVKNSRYRTVGPIGRALAEIAAAGYEAVELFDGDLPDDPAAETDFRRALSDAGLGLLAAYAGGNLVYDDILPDELWRIERTARSAAALGAAHLVVGGGAVRASGPRPDDRARLGAALERVREIAAKYGLAAHYHPHLTTLAETPDEIAAVFRHTAIGFCPDTAHLAAGGGDPAAVMAAHRDRIRYVHLKGWQRDPFRFTPLDRGDLDLAPVLAILRDFDGDVAVELDAWDDPAAAARASRNVLRRALSGR